MTEADWGEYGSPDCSPVPRLWIGCLDWVLGLGYCGFRDAVPVVMVWVISSEGPQPPHQIHFKVDFQC